jgi:hypothetical protein
LRREGATEGVRRRRRKGGVGDWGGVGEVEWRRTSALYARPLVQLKHRSGDAHKAKLDDHGRGKTGITVPKRA